MPVAEEQMLDVLSVLDSNDEPVYSNCTLQMGDIALEFKNGRSKVPAEHAAAVLRNPNCMVPGYGGPAADPVPSVAMALDVDVRQVPQLSEAERQARIAASAEYLQSQGLPVPAAETPAAGPDVSALEARIADLEQMLADAVALQPAADGGEPQEPAGESEADATAAGDGEPQLPDGIEPQTTDGKPRCWSRKGDGSQCTNPSVEGSHACNLKAHQKKIAQ